MVHGFKIENDKLILDVEEILQYPLLQQIYARDDSKDKSFAEKEFRFILYLSDRKGYVTKAGLTKKEAYAYAKSNAGLDESYLPDKVVLSAIEFVKSNLNITAVEDLINSTIKSLNLSSKLVRTLTDGIEDLMSKELEMKDLALCEDTLKQIIKIANEIPARVESLTELNDKWDKIEKGVTSIRGGAEYRDSYDGTMIEHLTLLTKQKHYRKDNRYGYETGRSPFIDYILEDKESYKLLSSSICRFTGKPWIDRDNDFLIGESGGVLMKIDFVFVGTEIFSRVADFYEKHGCYCLEPDDSPNAVKFWQREMDRRVKGVQAYCKLYIKDIPAYLAAKSDAERKALLHKVRITGDHYNYLNYGRIERAPNEKERKQLDKEGRFKVNTVEGFPRFWDGDYWNFKIDELIANNSCNLCKAKARRKGFHINVVVKQLILLTQIRM